MLNSSMHGQVRQTTEKPPDLCQPPPPYFDLKLSIFFQIFTTKIHILQQLMLKYPKMMPK